MTRKIVFTAAATNTGRVTLSSCDYRDPVTLHHPDGAPLKAGDIPAGGEVTFNRVTGEVQAIKPPTLTIDLTEWCRDLIMRWDVYERTRWEGEGGLIPPDTSWP